MISGAVWVIIAAWFATIVAFAIAVRQRDDCRRIVDADRRRYVNGHRVSESYDVARNLEAFLDAPDSPVAPVQVCPDEDALECGPRSEIPRATPRLDRIVEGVLLTEAPAESEPAWWRNGQLP